MRPKDDKGQALPPAHKRHPQAAAAEQAGYFAMCEDARGAALPMYRKLRLTRAVIDHVVDGAAVPKWIDKHHGEGGGLRPLWRAALDAVTAALKSG